MDNFFQAYDVELSKLEKVEGKKDVSWQKYQLSDVWTSHGEVTGGKYWLLMHLTFSNIFVFIFNTKTMNYIHSLWEIVWKV